MYVYKSNPNLRQGHIMGMHHPCTCQSDARSQLQEGRVQFHPFISTLRDVFLSVEDLSKRSRLKRILWRKSISTRIQYANRDVADALKELDVRFLPDKIITM